MPKKKRNVAGIIINILLTLFVVFVFFTLSTSFLSDKGYSLLGYRTFIVLTGSMSPTFDEGSYIIVREKPVAEIKEGEIICFRMPESGATVTHRVAKTLTIDGAPAFITKGDANNIEDDPPVLGENVYGVTVFWVNQLGSWLLKLHDIKTLGLVVALIIVLFFVPDILRYIFKKEDDEEDAKDEGKGEGESEGGSDETSDCADDGKKN